MKIAKITILSLSIFSLNSVEKTEAEFMRELERKNRPYEILGGIAAGIGVSGWYFKNIGYDTKYIMHSIALGALAGILGSKFVKTLNTNPDLERARLLFKQADIEKFENLALYEVLEKLYRDFANKKYPLVSAYENLRSKKRILLESKRLYEIMIKHYKSDLTIFDNTRIDKLDNLLNIINGIISCVESNVDFQNQIQIKLAKQLTDNSQQIADDVNSMKWYSLLKGVASLGIEYSKIQEDSVYGYVPVSKLK